MEPTVITSRSCGRCGRPLKSPPSLAAGFGPVCLRKLDRDSGTWQEEGYEFLADRASERGVVLCRRPNGVIAGNIPWSHRHHSPGGFEWGYGGSGPADLALNIAAMLAPVNTNGDGMEPVKLHDGSLVSPLAFAMHQDLKWNFVSCLDRDATEVFIDGELLDAWAASFAKAWAKSSYLALIAPEVIVLRRFAPLDGSAPVSGHRSSEGV